MSKLLNIAIITYEQKGAKKVIKDRSDTQERTIRVVLSSISDKSKENIHFHVLLEPKNISGSNTFMPPKNSKISTISVAKSEVSSNKINLDLRTKKILGKQELTSDNQEKSNCISTKTEISSNTSKKSSSNNPQNFSVNQEIKPLIKRSSMDLTGISLEDLKKLLVLPDNLMLGSAVDDGGCFFDSLAQALNFIQNTNEHNEKSLRKKCHAYYYKNKKEIDQRNEKEFGGIDKGDDYAFVQYTKQELDENFNKRIPIWGRTEIEGVMLCNELNLTKILVIELIPSTDNENNKCIIQIMRVEKDGVHSEEDVKTSFYAQNTPILIINKGHFVPILPKKYCFQEIQRSETNKSKHLQSYLEHTSKVQKNQDPKKIDIWKDLSSGGDDFKIAGVLPANLYDNHIQL